MPNKYAQHSKAKQAFEDVHHASDWVKGCGSKVRYQSAGNARAVAKKVFTSRKVRLNFYHCRHCSGWHLTKRGAKND